MEQYIIGGKDITAVYSRTSGRSKDYQEEGKLRKSCWRINEHFSLKSSGYLKKIDLQNMDFKTRIKLLYSRKIISTRSYYQIKELYETMLDKKTFQIKDKNKIRGRSKKN